MSLTNFNEFKKLFSKIPKDRLEYVHFIPLRTGTKVPIGNWKGKHHLSYYDIKNVMGFGGNIAIVAIPKGLMYLDIDVKNYPDGIPKQLLDIIPNTLTVKTRSGGLHFYFLNDGFYDNQKFMMLSKEESIKKDDLIYVEVGELRTNWQYVVCAGSWVEPEIYKVINDTYIESFVGYIMYLFKNGYVKDLSPKETPPTVGKVGKPVSEEHRRLIELNKNRVSGHIKPEIDERRKEILDKLKERRL